MNISGSVILFQLVAAAYFGRVTSSPSAIRGAAEVDLGAHGLSRPGRGISNNDADSDTNATTLGRKLQMSLMTVGNNGNPASAFPLRECEGDCDDDTDCESGLVCYQRSSSEEVHGCSGPGISKDDYCFNRPSNFLYHPTADPPHGLCEGDCDDDSECLPGYICFQRRMYAPIPTCFGSGRRGADYCILDGTAAPTNEPTVGVTASPTDEPTGSPITSNPSARPTFSPVTGNPTKSPTNSPVASTSSPTKSPTSEPTSSTVTSSPSLGPTNSPVTNSPTSKPVTDNPSKAPTDSPMTASPTDGPTNEPITASPTKSPTLEPTNSPVSPNQAPSTISPTKSPTNSPVAANPTKAPTNSPATDIPTKSPTVSPVTGGPSGSPTKAPSTNSPSARPTGSPVTASPTNSPTNPVTLSPTESPVGCTEDSYILTYAVNAGGSAYGPASDGYTYTTDDGFFLQNGSTWSGNPGNAIPYDVDLYSTERNAPNDIGQLNYEFPVEVGKKYKVTLRFMEIWSRIDTRGPRVFDVRIEDQLQWAGVDVYNAVGLAVPYDLEYTFTAADNTLDIDLVSVRNRAKISAIVVEEMQCPTTGTGTPTKSPTENPTTQPTNFPTGTQPSTLEPTGRPTTSPSASPTTTAPTGSPTTVAPTGSPTTLSTPTEQPTKTPTNPLPTNSPTSYPTRSPLDVGGAIKCPPVGSSMAIYPGMHEILPAASDTYCGIFLEKQSGDFIPVARSYNNEGWEAAPGPLACPAEDVTTTAITLPNPQDADDVYVIISRDGFMDRRKQVAKFLEMTTFGTRASELNDLDNNGWGEAARAVYLRDQIDLPATSHRAHFRRNSNTKLDAPIQPARSDHPCSPNSKWRKYSYTRNDRYDSLRDGEGDETEISFELVPEEAGLSATILECDSSSVSTSGLGEFENKFSGYSGSRYYRFYDPNSGNFQGDWVEWTFSMPSGGTYPIAFRYMNGENDFNGDRKLQLWVNDVLVVNAYNFEYTGFRFFEYWRYSAMLDVSLSSGQNKIKLVSVDNPGPYLDHLRIGKPAAVLIKTNGYPRTVARNGIQLQTEWGYDFDGKVGVIADDPEAPQGDLYSQQHVGRVEVTIGSKTDYLDIGNPPIDFTGYEEYLPPNVFRFTPSDIFQETGSDLAGFPLQRGQELLLTNGFSGPVCDSVPAFAEGYNDAPIIGELPNGEWVMWTPTIQFENNGPEISDTGDRTANVLRDGGGGLVVQTGDRMKCSNVPRSFINENTCFLSTESTSCSASQIVGEVMIPMTKSNVVEFYNLSEKYVYAIRDLPMEDLVDHACRKSKSRWEVQVGASCSAPTSLQAATVTALTNAITSSSDTNEFTKDVTRTQSCASADETVDKIDIQIEVGGDCYTHVHPEHLNVYDFTLWVNNHPGGANNIQKWAQGHQGSEGWHLDFNPRHPLTYWSVNAIEPNVVYVTRLGDDIAFRDLSNELKTDAIAEYFGATGQPMTGGGVIVCGSVGEVANDPSLGEHFDVKSELDEVSSREFFENQKQVVWTEIVLSASDQLRQRMAWALAQILTIVPGNIVGDDLTEIYVNYQDSMVKHAFGNYRDLLLEASHSPLMGEHLSFVNSRSRSYVYKNEEKKVASADENFAREVMQLFTIGLYELNDNGTPVINPTTGEPLATYGNDDIMSFARAWTGFVMSGARGNYETDNTRGTGNHLDPMYIEPDYRDPFPKTDLSGGFIGDKYLLCTDLPSQSFLKAGAKYRLLGGKPLPDLTKDPSYFGQENGILRLELDPTSPLYQRLYNDGKYELTVELDSDLSCPQGLVECAVDTLRIVKVGTIFYEFVERPCVQFSFYDNGKQIQLRSNNRYGQMCANPGLTHAREACCRADVLNEVRDATMEAGVTHKYDGERMTWESAKDRCVAYGRDLCLYNNLQLMPTNDDNKKGYHWTDQDCGINVKVNPEGQIAIVHDAVSSEIDTIPWHVEEVNTLNWFGVHWNDGSYPGNSHTNTCQSNGCKSMPDGSCLCRTNASESAVFTDLNVSKDDILSSLFLVALSPNAGSTANNLGNGVIAHVLNNHVDINTVFEVGYRGRTTYLKNVVSTVSVEGWTLAPEIYEAEDALTNNAPVATSNSATGGSYVETKDSDQSGYVQWNNVNVPSQGKYLISLRYALNDNARPMSVFVNGQEVTRTPTKPNSPIPLDYLGNNPSSSYPLSRCQGDCDNNGHCQDGLICFQRSGTEEVYGCTGNSNHVGQDFCADAADIPSGFVMYPTGGWNQDWKYSNPLEVDLNAGANTIRVQVSSITNRGPNIDHMKIEGMAASTSTSFRNPPHFMSLIADEFSGSSPGGLGEQNLRDAQYETEAVIDEYFHHPNMAPFLCTRVMQRFSFSNPSPRFVTSCVEAFRTGLYSSGGKIFGSGQYGSLEAMAASILLDKEATDSAIVSDPSHGAMREPILKLTNLMRSMDYQTAIPTTLDGSPMQTTHNVKVWELHKKIGQGPFDFPSVFSFFLPEYIPDSGRALTAKLTSPETSLVNMANNVGLLNGMISLIKYGLSDCNDGLTLMDVDLRTLPDCTDDGLFERSYGHLFYQPSGVTDLQKATDLSLLLTSGRLSDDNLNAVVAACSTESNETGKTRCMQQLIVTTGEFHTTNKVTQSGRLRTVGSAGGTTIVPYKALVYFYFDGGLDSHNMLAPHTCAPIDVYEKYRDIRGGRGLDRTEMLEIPANNGDQPCASFGIHQNLPLLKQLYDRGDLNFVANAGLLAKPVNVDNYKDETPVNLFGHNVMQKETKANDILNEYSGTGVGGRIADVLTQMGIPTETFSIEGTQLTLTGEAGQGPGQAVISSSGVPVFNANPSIENMNDVIRALNNATEADSGFYADTWGQKLVETVSKNELLKQEIDGTELNAIFPDSDLGEQLALVARIMMTREARGSLRDIFYVQDRGYDHHSNSRALDDKFANVDASLGAFVSELDTMGVWESTTIVQFSEFARTLNGNSGGGTDHGWGGNHWIMGGSVGGGRVLGRYPTDFEEGDADGIMLSRGRMIPTTPWDAMWKGAAEWLGVPATGAGMEKVLPLHTNFPPSVIFTEGDLFV